MTEIKCTECNQSGGTVPKHYWDDVVELMHEECAKKSIQRYLDKKEGV